MVVVQMVKEFHPAMPDRKCFAWLRSRWSEGVLEQVPVGRTTPPIADKAYDSDKPVRVCSDKRLGPGLVHTATGRVRPKNTGMEENCVAATAAAGSIERTISWISSFRRLVVRHGLLSIAFSLP